MPKENEMKDLGLIKVCGDPHCEAIWHNIPKNITRCNDCGGRVMIINQDTFMKKYANNYFQYDFNTGEYYRPAIDKQLCLEFKI